MECSDLAQILHTCLLWYNVNFCQVSALYMLYGGFHEISKFWQFSSNFLVEFFKNHVKHQKIAQKYIQTYKSDVKFPAELNPVVRKNRVFSIQRHKWCRLPSGCKGGAIYISHRVNVWAIAENLEHLSTFPKKRYHWATRALNVWKGFRCKKHF